MSFKILRKSDPAIALALDLIGKPVVRTRPGGIAGLTRIIIAQQLSVASAQSILKRCEAAFDLTCVKTLLDAPEDDLRACGLSRPKVRYIKAAAEAIINGELDLDAIAKMSDEVAQETLLKIKGIGPWSAAIYLLFHEGRQTVWPSKDVALLAAYTHAAGLPERPAQEDFDVMAAQRFSPHAGLAAHILWTYYGVIKERTPV